MKKLLYTILAAMCCMVTNAQTAFEVNSIKYSVTSESTVEVVAKDSKYTGNVVIPSAVTYSNTTYNVTGIGDNAFRDCRDLTSITIPKGVTSIGDFAFMGSTGLTSIIIQEGVTSIGAQAFDNTGWYNKHEDGLVYLCKYLLRFKGENQPENIEIEDGTMTIADGALRSCWSLVSITIPNSVTSIGDWAFPSYLNSITVDSGNPVYDSRNNCNAIIETATKTLIAGCKNTIIPSEVTSIGNDAFRVCDKLTSVTIPSGVTHIGENAFFNCSGLTEIDVLATTPPTLGDDAFWGVPTGIPVYVPDVETYTSWGGFTNLKKYVDLPTAKNEAIAEINGAMKDITTFTEAEKQSIQLCKENINAATTLTKIKSNKDAALVIIELRQFKDKDIADLQIFINEEKIANPPMEEYADRINAATTVDEIQSIVNNIKAEINNYTKFTLGEWKYLLDKNDGKYAIVGGSLTFTDKELYQCDYNFTANNLTYSRTFKATGVWQAWFVPFNVTVGKMNQAGMEVAKIAGVLMDGEVPYIAFAKMTDQYAIVNANTPYVVKATESSVNMTLTGPDMCIRKSTDAELKAQRLTVQSSFDTFTFGGNYQQTNGYENEWYALNTSGVFQKMGEDANLAPQRFWMKIDTRTDTPYHTGSSATAKAFIGMTVLGDDETTGIQEASPKSSPEGKDLIYNLQGQRVTSIQKGQVYIMNGKKFFAR